MNKEKFNKWFDSNNIEEKYREVAFDVWKDARLLLYEDFYNEFEKFDFKQQLRKRDQGLNNKESIIKRITDLI